MNYENGSSNNAGSVAYEYCLTCDSAMSRRFVHDGLALYRVDQIYDDDSNGLSDTDEWRVWWENTTMPALLGGHLAKRFDEPHTSFP